MPRLANGSDVHRPSVLDHPPGNERFLALYNPSALPENTIQLQPDEDELLELEELLEMVTHVTDATFETPKCASVGTPSNAYREMYDPTPRWLLFHRRRKLLLFVPRTKKRQQVNLPEKVVMDPVGRHVSDHRGRRKNTTMDCGAVALHLELFSRPFFCVAYRTWLPRHWKRSDRDHLCWHRGQYHWDAIRHMTGSHRLPSRTCRALDTCFCCKLRDASCRVAAAGHARPFGPVAHIIQLIIQQL